MNITLRNILAVIAGVVIGGAVNMGIIFLSGFIIPPPEGVNPSNMESLKSSMHLFEAKHFIMPFLAHSLGTFMGAFLTSLIAGSHKLKFVLLIGIFFLLGGIANVVMLPAPTWFSILDLIVAYIPMACLGGKLAIGKNKKWLSSKN